MDSMSKLGGNLVTSSLKDPRLAGLSGHVDASAATPKVADPMRAALGGSGKAPCTDKQVPAAADRLTPEQKSAVPENFSSALNSVTTKPALRDAVTKSLGSKTAGDCRLTALMKRRRTVAAPPGVPCNCEPMRALLA